MELPMFLPRSSRRVAGAAAVITLGLGAVGTVVAGPASAAPKGDPFTITCDNGTTYSAVSPPGNGNFTPALAANGARLIPVAFGETTFVLTQNGVVIESDTQAPIAKGSSARNPNATVSCSFSGSQTFVEDGDTFVGTFSGTVQGFVAGHVK